MTPALRLSVVVGVRPNFVKVAALFRALKDFEARGCPMHARLVHTGQHYDHALSQSFLIDLGIPEPDVNFEIGGGSSIEQVSRMLLEFEKEFRENRPDLVVVVGDVNSTLAAGMTAKFLQIPIAHIEAGLRSGDMRMPEEINRILTDSITDYFFTTSRLANERLKTEGHPESRIHFVGNTMIDTLQANVDRFRKPAAWDKLQLKKKGFLLLTLHRPSNVDNPAFLSQLLFRIEKASRPLPVVCPLHPRTKQRLKEISGFEPSQIHFVEALPYLEFMYLVQSSFGVLTDSGGIQEETTWLRVPCLTLRDSTERPETVTVGTNELVGLDPVDLEKHLEVLLSGRWKAGGIPELWDGMAAVRILEIVREQFLTSRSTAVSGV